MQYKSLRDRQKCMNELLDHLSFNYDDFYTLLWREMKKREVESNDPKKITKWLSDSNPGSLLKLHEALLLVKTNNIIAQELYLNYIKIMLYQTIINRTNTEVAVKMCCLIEKSSHLKIIYKHLKYYIQHVNQLNCDYHSVSLENAHSHIQVDYLRQSNIQYARHIRQLKHAPVWPIILQPTSLTPNFTIPQYNENLKCFDHDNNEMVSTINSWATFDWLPLTLFNASAVNQDMDKAIVKWLRYLKLHKYEWFFTNLSYFEIERVNENNIEEFITKVNINTITKGAQKKICISTKTLRDRPKKLKNLLLALELEVTQNELCEFMRYMHDILNYPIPNGNCLVGDELQQDIVIVMEKSLNQLLEKLSVVRSLYLYSLLGMSINIYLKCVLQITENGAFMKHQVNQIAMFNETLKCKIHQFLNI